MGVHMHIIPHRIKTLPLARLKVLPSDAAKLLPSYPCAHTVTQQSIDTVPA